MMSQFIAKVFDYVVVCGLVIAALAIGTIFYNIYLHPLHKYPGPKLWVATRLTWAKAMQSGHYHHMLHELHVQYGPVVRIAPNELSFIKAEAWKDIYGNRNIPKNHTWAGQQELRKPISIVSVDEPTHLRNRRALMGAFTEHAIVEHEPILENLIRTMINKFKEAVESGQGQANRDIVNWLNLLMFDISGALSFGESFGSTENGCAHPWVEISCNFGKGIALMASINFFHPLDKLLKMAMPKKVMEKMQYHKQLAHEKFEQRLRMQHKSKTQDYVGSIMAYNETKDEVQIPMDEIEANMTLLIFAGSETTSTALVSILNQLLQNPAALQRVQDEVRVAFGATEEITIATTTRLKYLDAVINEGIRMGPPAAIGLPRVTPKEGASILGEHVPGGVFVSVNQYPMFRSTSNFTAPDSFVPERFLANSPFPNDRLDAFQPFLIGRHKCIGQKLAWAIMRLTLAQLLYSFDLKLVGEKMDFGDQNTFIFWEKKPVDIELRCINEIDGT